MNKNDLINAVAEQSKLDKTQAKAAVEAVVDAISSALVSGDKVQLVGFGTFEVKERPARDARNPRTGEPIHIEASKAPLFKAGKSLKDAVNN